MGAVSRVNCVKKLQNSWLFGYQDGKILCVNEGFDSCYQVYENKREITSIAIGEGDSPSCLIGLGSLQVMEDPGEVLDTKLKHVQGMYSIGK